MAAETSAAPTRRRWWRLLLAVPVLLVTAYGGLQLLLNAPFVKAAIAGPTTRVRVEWSTLYMLVPGRFEVRGLRVQSDTRSMQWGLELDRARVDLRIGSLWRRTFETESVAGEGLVFRLRRKPPAEAPAPPDTTFLPPLPGLELGTRRPPPARRRPPGWRFRLAGVEIERLAEVWVDAYRLTGQGRASGVIDVQVRGPLALEGLEVRFEDASLSDRGEVVARSLAVATRLDLEPALPAELRSVEVLDQLDGELRLTAESGAIGFLGPLFQRAGVDLRGEGHRLDVDLGIAGGALRPGSRFDIEAGRFAAAFPVIGVEGTGEIHGAVTTDGLTVHAALPELDLTVEGDRRIGSAKGFALTVRSRSSDLSDLLEGGDSATAVGEARDTETAGSSTPVPATAAPAAAESESESAGRRARAAAALRRAAAAGVVLEVALADGNIEDLSPFAELFPPGDSFRLEGGAAHIEAHALLQVEEGAARLRLRGDDIGLTVMGEPLRADLDLVLEADSQDPRSRWFDVEQGALAFESVAWDGEGGGGDWWARLELANGRVRLTRPIELVSGVALEMRDTRPLVHMLAQEHRAIRWLRGLLNIKNVEGTARLALDGRSLRLRDVAIDGKGLLVRGQMDLRQPPRALLLLELHGLRAGVELEDHRRDVRILKPRQWYDRRAATWPPP